jgi:hypothetical protein
LTCFIVALPGVIVRRWLAIMGAVPGCAQWLERTLVRS